VASRTDLFSIPYGVITPILVLVSPFARLCCIFAFSCPANTGALCENEWTDPNAVCWADRLMLLCITKESCMRWGPDPPHGTGQFCRVSHGLKSGWVQRWMQSLLCGSDASLCQLLWTLVIASNWLTELQFHAPLDTKLIISETFSHLLYWCLCVGLLDKFAFVSCRPITCRCWRRRFTPVVKAISLCIYSICRPHHSV